MNLKQKIPNILQRDAHRMQAVSCMSPEQVICPTKFINESQLTSFRNYCTPTITSCKSAVYLQLKAAPLWFSSVTSHQYFQSVTLQQTDVVTWGGRGNRCGKGSFSCAARSTALVWLAPLHHGYEHSPDSSLQPGDCGSRDRDRKVACPRQIDNTD